MGNFTRGKDGRLYYGKGTQGGLAPDPTRVPSAGGSLPYLPERRSVRPNLDMADTYPESFPGQFDAIGNYSKTQLIREGFTVDEIADIETRPAAADLPNVSWGRLAIEEADKIGYESIAKLSGGKYLVAAAYDNLVENHDLNGLPKSDEESRRKAVNYSLPLQKLLISMKHSAAENNYSQADIDRINGVLSGYNGPDYLNNRAYTLDSTDGRVVYTNDMVRLLDLAKVSYQEESANPSEQTQRLLSKASAQNRYMGKATTGNGQNGGYVAFDKKPSKQLINARIESKKAEKAYNDEARKPARFDIFGRQEKKLAALEAKRAQAVLNLRYLEAQKNS